MAEKSIYEQGHPSRKALNNAICFGRVHSVDPSRRLCSVKTFFATHPSANDQFIQNCQWLNMDANPAGDEVTSVPRRGSIGMVVFVQGEPFIFGYFKPLNKSGQALTGKEKANLTEGDKILSTQAGNYVLIKANGSIEIKSKETLKTLYFPTKSLLQHLVRNYEMKADGGVIDWKSDKDGTTKYSATFRKDIAATFVVLEERGSVDGVTISRTLIGPGVGGLAGSLSVYKHEVDITGETRLTVGPPGVEAFKGKIDATGLLEIETIGDVNVKSTLGAITVNAIAQDIKVLADTGDIDIEATVGAVQMTGSLAKLKLAQGMVGMGAGPNEVVDLMIQTQQLCADMAQSIQQLTVLGNLGYPTSVPINVADFVKHQVTATLLKTKTTAIKGGI